MTDQLAIRKEFLKARVAMEEMHQLRDIEIQSAIVLSNKIIKKKVMSSKASAFCSLKQRTNQYHRWRCTDSFGELIERFISRFRSREKDLMPEDFDIQDTQMFVEIKQKMEVALKVHSSEKVDGLKKKFKKNVAQVNKKRSDQSSRIRNLRHVLSTYESGVNLKINEEVLFNIKVDITSLLEALMIRNAKFTVITQMKKGMEQDIEEVVIEPTIPQ